MNYKNPGGTTILPITKERAEILRVKNMLQNNGVDPSGFIISRSDLRLELLADATKEKYDFKVKEGAGTVRSLEQRLSQNDLFFLTEIALCISKQDAIASPEEYANTPLYTFPDPNFFLVANEAKSLETLYNGKMLLKTSITDRIPAILTHNFRYAPQSQTVGSAFIGVTADTVPEYGPNDQARGYYSLGEAYGMDGAEDNMVSVVLGAGLRSAIAGTAPDVNVFVCLLKGILVSEGARKVTEYLKRNPFV